MMRKGKLVRDASRTGEDALTVSVFPATRRLIVLGSMDFGVKSKVLGTKTNGKELHELQL